MKIILPLFVVLPRKKSPNKIWRLGLNSYRNTHFHILNQAKTLWKDIVATALSKSDKNITTGNLLCFRYTIYPSSNRKFDIANVCSVIDKFTCDALIEFGVISDDSYKVISRVVYEIGTVDKENPHCELEITSAVNFTDLPF